MIELRENNIVVNTVSYRPVQPVFVLPFNQPVPEPPSKCTSSISQPIPNCTGHQLVQEPSSKCTSSISQPIPDCTGYTGSSSSIQSTGTETPFEMYQFNIPAYSGLYRSSTDIVQVINRYRSYWQFFFWYCTGHQPVQLILALAFFYFLLSICCCHFGSYIICVII